MNFKKLVQKPKWIEAGIYPQFCVNYKSWCMNQSGSRRHAGLGLSPILCKLKSRCKKSESRRRAGFPVRRLDCYEPEILQPVVVIIRVFGLVPQDYDTGIPGIKLHCAADAVGLRTGHERAARAIERVYHHAIWCRAVFDRISQQRASLSTLYCALGLF